MTASDHSCSLTRRDLLRRTGLGFGSLALGQLLGGQGLLAPAAADSIRPLAPGCRSFRPRPSTSFTCS